MTDRSTPAVARTTAATGPVVLRPPLKDVAKVLIPTFVVGIASLFRLGAGAVTWLLALVCLAAGSAGVYRQLTMRVELHRDELVVVNWRSHRIARTEVTAVETGRVLLTPRAFVLTRDGRRTPLSALDGRAVAGDGQRFSDEVARIERWRCADA